jgi:hypothetical protein
MPPLPASVAGTSLTALHSTGTEQLRYWVTEPVSEWSSTPQLASIRIQVPFAASPKLLCTTDPASIATDASSSFIGMWYRVPGINT